MGVAPGVDLVARVDERAGEIMGQFNPQELSNLVWACGVLRIRPSPGMLVAVEARLGEILHCSPAQVRLRTFVRDCADLPGRTSTGFDRRGSYCAEVSAPSCFLGCRQLTVGVRGDGGVAMRRGGGQVVQPDAVPARG